MAENTRMVIFIVINLSAISIFQAKNPSKKGMSWLSGHGIELAFVLSLNPTCARLWQRPCGRPQGAVPEPIVEYIVLKSLTLDKQHLLL